MNLFTVNESDLIVIQITGQLRIVIIKKSKILYKSGFPLLQVPAAPRTVLASRSITTPVQYRTNTAENNNQCKYPKFSIATAVSILPRLLEGTFLFSFDRCPRNVSARSCVSCQNGSLPIHSLPANSNTSKVVIFYLPCIYQYIVLSA